MVLRETFIQNEMKTSILVVEDDQFITNAFKFKFEEAGFKVKVAYNGQEAIDVLKEFKPDIIILDIVMPVKNGFEVLEEIKKDKRLSSVPVIVATNLGQEQHVIRALQMGVSEYIVKSELSLNDLVAKVKSMT